MNRDFRVTGSSRRDVLKGAAGMVAAALTGGRVAHAASGEIAAPIVHKRVLRIAHLTDIHVRPEYHGDKGMAACLRHVQEHSHPDLVLNTGDTIMDSMQTEQARVRMYWDLAQRIWKTECSVPVEHAIGNHDVWGIRKERSKTTGDEPLYGKKWVMSLHGWERPYRSFDRSGWHFIAIDTIGTDNDYYGCIDEEQYEWLAEDLARVNPKTPILVFGHIPLLSVAAFFKGKSEVEDGFEVPARVMVKDARMIKDLFRKYPNVKLALSGHIHLVDRVDYLGVSYLCGGAVSGNRWRGAFQECEPGYGVIDLYADGTFENEYVTYGWKAQT